MASNTDAQIQDPEVRKFAHAVARQYLGRLIQGCDQSTLLDVAQATGHHRIGNQLAAEMLAPTKENNQPVFGYYNSLCDVIENFIRFEQED